MTEIANLKTSSKPTSEMKPAAALLQSLLVELVHLELQTKQLHWNVRGSHFSPIHEFLDELTDAYRGYSDRVAERIRALEEPADGRLSRMAKESRLSEITGDLISDQEVLQLIDSHLGLVIRQGREVRCALADIDAVSEDLILELLATLEKQAWMIRSQLAR